MIPPLFSCHRGAPCYSFIHFVHPEGLYFPQIRDWLAFFTDAYWKLNFIRRKPCLTKPNSY